MLISALLLLGFRVNIKKDKYAISPYNLPGQPFLQDDGDSTFSYLDVPLAGSPA